MTKWMLLMSFGISIFVGAACSKVDRPDTRIKVNNSQQGQILLSWLSIAPEQEGKLQFFLTSFLNKLEADGVTKIDGGERLVLTEISLELGKDKSVDLVLNVDANDQKFGFDLEANRSDTTPMVVTLKTGQLSFYVRLDKSTGDFQLMIKSFPDQNVQLDANISKYGHALLVLGTKSETGIKLLSYQAVKEVLPANEPKFDWSKELGAFAGTEKTSFASSNEK